MSLPHLACCRAVKVGEATITVGDVIEVAEDNSKATEDGVALGLLQALWQTSTGVRVELHLTAGQVFAWCTVPHLHRWGHVLGAILAAQAVPVAPSPPHALWRTSTGQSSALTEAAASDAAYLLTRDKPS